MLELHLAGLLVKGVRTLSRKWGLPDFYWDLDFLLGTSFLEITIFGLFLADQTQEVSYCFYDPIHSQRASNGISLRWFLLGGWSSKSRLGYDIFPNLVPRKAQGSLQQPTLLPDYLVWFGRVPWVLQVDGLVLGLLGLVLAGLADFENCAGNNHSFPGPGDSLIAGLGIIGLEASKPHVIAFFIYITKPLCGPVE